MALGGLAQNFGQLVGTRLFVGAAVRPTGLSSYSLLVDAFLPKCIPLVFALLQLGYIGGTSLGQHRRRTDDRAGPARCGPSSSGRLAIFNWQLVLIMARRAARLAALLFLKIEPPRAARHGRCRATARRRALRAQVRRLHGLGRCQGDICQSQGVFLPLFAALALSAVESQGLPAGAFRSWSAPIGWNEAEIGALARPAAARLDARRASSSAACSSLARQALQGRQYPRDGDHLRLHDGDHASSPR